MVSFVAKKKVRITGKNKVFVDKIFFSKFTVVC